ncbi:hypothetical protein [Photobacterium sp. 53610]|uniref:hypothetical protein n=1 Tax=Photobacterium sp. 53610 TaxID=3102789 RepID=UPI002ED932C0
MLRRLRTQFGIVADELAEMGARDERYTVFDNVRDYRKRDEDFDLDNSEAMLLELLGQLRTQRDELDAVETFARVVAAQQQLNNQELLELSRIVGDEARHVLTGELALANLGHDPRAIPVGVIGSLLRRELSPIDGLLQISMIGEAGNVAEILQSASLANSLGHPRIGIQLQLIHRDEIFHLKCGHKILRRIKSIPQGAGFAQVALDITNEYLVSHGQPKLSARQAARILGE